MNAFIHFETTIGEHPFPFQLFWDEHGRLLKVVCLPEPSLEAVEENTQPPYAVAAIIRDLKYFFSQGEPLLPLHWSLLNTDALTDFSKRVYEATSLIPHGETRTYSWVAQRIGKPLAARAVGQALRRNPFPILVPCHRVVADKSLGGFMGSTHPEDLELRFKHWLLDLERSYRNPYFSFLSSIPTLQASVS